MINVYEKVKKYCSCQKDYSWNFNTCISESSRYSKSIVDNLVIVCNEIINATDSVKSTVSTNSHDKKVRHELLCFAQVFISDYINIYYPGENTVPF